MVKGLRSSPRTPRSGHAESLAGLDSVNTAGGRTEGKEKVLEEGSLNDRARGQGGSWVSAGHTSSKKEHRFYSMKALVI